MMTFWFASCGGVESFLNDGGACSTLTSVTPSTTDLTVTTISREVTIVKSESNVDAVDAVAAVAAAAVGNVDDNDENNSIETPNSHDQHTTKSSTSSWLLSVASGLSRNAVILSSRDTAKDLNATIQKENHPLHSAVEIVKVRLQ
jgi:hypothetical protein